MYKSQNSVSGRPSYPPCARYGKSHHNECLAGQKGCYSCGKLGQRIRDCPHAKQGNRDGHPQTQATSAPIPLGRQVPPQGTSSSIGGDQCQIGFMLYHPIRSGKIHQMLLLVCFVSFILVFMCC